MLGLGVVGLMDLDLVAVVVGGRDGFESGPLGALGESAEPGEQVDCDQVVVGEPAALNCGPVLSGRAHRFTAASVAVPTGAASSDASGPISFRGSHCPAAWSYWPRVMVGWAALVSWRM